MWRFIALAALGIVLGSKARSERALVVWALIFGLLYGGMEVLTTAAVTGPLSTGRVLLLLGLGLVMAAPVYATAEIWRRTHVRVRAWLRRTFKQGR
jgi:hypothetical protein